MKKIDKDKLLAAIHQNDHKLACTMLKDGQTFEMGAMLGTRRLYGFDSMSDTELMIFGQMASSMANAYIDEQQRRGLLPSDEELQGWVRMFNPLIPTPKN